MSGAGIAPAGTSPYGFGTPDAAPIPGGSLFRDPLTGATLSGRRIDAATGDYEVDSYGRIIGMTAGQQAVYLAMKTELGSSAMVDLGNRLLSIETITEDFEADVRRQILAALQRSIVSGLISRVSVDVSHTGSRGFAIVRWFDQSTQTEQSLTI